MSGIVYAAEKKEIAVSVDCPEDLTVFHDSKWTKQLGISTHQLSYVTHSGEGEGLLFYGSTILPFVDHFPKNTELYRIMTTKPQELKKEDE